MRFVVAIVAFLVAAGMIAYGIAQRTVLAPADRVSAVTDLSSGAAFTVIDGAVLNSNPGQQRLSITGNGTVFAAYARTADVAAWLGAEKYNRIGYDASAGKLTSAVATATPAEQSAPPATPAATVPVPTATPATATPAPAPTAQPGPNPAGSDLWLEENSGTGTLDWTVSVPRGISVIVASDGTAPAPQLVELTWPVNNSTPWAGPLIIAGGVLLLVGLALYIWGLVHMRRTRGPRRKAPPRPPKLPTPPRNRAVKARPLEPATTAKGRRAVRRSALSLAAMTLTIGTVLSGCSALPALLNDQQPMPSLSPTSSSAPKEPAVPVAVTVPQLERIMTRVSAVAKDADATRNVDTLKTRFAGPALSLREANYSIRAKIADYAAPAAIPAGPLQLKLPEQTDSWPRTVFTVVQQADPSVPPLALLLIQKSPRENYLVHYAITLEANITLPDVAAANVGAARLGPDNKLLALRPSDLAAAYGDILSKPDSAFLPKFDATTDKLRTQVGVEYKKKTKAGFPTTASLDFASVAGMGEIIPLATTGSGAIVATSLSESTTVKPIEPGASVNAEGAVEALVGKKSSTKGFESIYGYQLLFYVPPALDNAGKVVLLGYAQGLASAREL